jgi:deoxyribose-phosphate aldolase
MDLSEKELASMIDISAVRADSTMEEVRQIVHLARKYRFLAVFTLPSMSSYAKELLAKEKGILLGGTVGFPSGGSTTPAKAFEAQELIDAGCDELDMVINIGKLKSALYDDVAEDIGQIVSLASPLPVKVILEVSLLTQDEICEGAKIVRDSGARFIKTGTGWGGPTTFDHIRAIKNAVNDDIALKVAGGVRNLDVLLKMWEMGVSRFGVGYRSAMNIIETFNQLQEGLR